MKAIEYGFQKNEIEKKAYEYQKEIEEKEVIIVGVNKFTSDVEEKHELFKVDDNVRLQQIEKIKRLKEKRDNKKVSQCLNILKQKSQTNENLLPFMLDAIENYATIGEISNTLRSEWGEYV